MTQGGVIRRKLAATRPPLPEGDGAARAWRVAFARAALEGIGLDLTVPSLRDDRQSLAELLELIPDRALLALLEGPGQGLGLLVMSPELLASVIEAQTIGRVGAAAPLPRRPTRTDAAMSARVIDQALGLLDAALLTSPDLGWAGGFRYASFLDEVRALGLLLEDVPYRVLSCALEIGGGARRGQVLLALPAEGRGPVSAPPPTGPDTPLAQWEKQLQGAVMGAEVALQAVVGRIRLPLAQALTLEPGMVLPLCDGGVDRVQILGPGAGELAQGRLGQYRGMRALRLRLDADREAAPPGPAPGADPAVAAPPPPLARSA